MRKLVLIALAAAMAACTAPKFLTSNRCLGKEKIVRTVVQKPPRKVCLTTTSRFARWAKIFTTNRAAKRR